MTFVDLDRGWFIPNLLFKRVVMDRSVADGNASGNDNNDNVDDGSGSSEGVFKAKKSEYKKEE